MTVDDRFEAWWKEQIMFAPGNTDDKRDAKSAFLAGRESGLEEAAKLAEDFGFSEFVQRKAKAIAAAIRALKEGK